MKKYIIALILAMFALVNGAAAADFTIHSKSAMTTLTADDLFLVEDSPGSSPSYKKLTWASLEANIKAYTDTLYQPLDTDLTALAAISGQRGDIIYFGASGWTKLSKGVDGQYLKIGANDPSWADVTGGGSMVYPDAGVAVSTGYSWTGSKGVGMNPYNLVELNSSGAFPAISAANLTNFPTLNQNTSGTAGNLSGTPALPNGTTATTQTAADNSTKLATTAYADTAAAARQASSATLTSLAGLTETNGGLPYGTADNTYAWLAAGAAGKVLQGNGAAAPSWSTPTYPSASGTARKVLVSDGTNNIYSTETWAIPGTSGNILKSDGTNWTSAAEYSYTHPSGDGNLHVPATSTVNNGKVLTAGATAGALSWQTPSGGAGSVATDTIWDAAGDLAIGTGADTAAKLTKGSNGQVLTAGASTISWQTPTVYQASDATLTALAGLTLADVSIIEGTGADAAAVVTSGGNNYFLSSNSGNTALEFKTPAATLAAIGAQASGSYQTGHAALTSIAGLTETNGGLPYGTADNTYAWLAAGAAGKVLQGNGAAAPSWSAPTYPSASGTARKMLVSDGTNNIYSTETWAIPGTSGNILKSDGTNWTSAAEYSYTHPSGDGNLHVPATSTTNNGKVLTAGATAGSLSWQTPSGGAGSVATDTIWDAAGDLAIGTGADTAAKLTKGSNGQVLTAGASTISWQTPTGGGDLKADGTVPLTANWNAGNYVVTAGGFDTNKVTDVAGKSTRYQATGTGVQYAGEIGPASMTGNVSYLLRDPAAGPTVANSVKTYGASTSGTGTTADPYIHSGTWKAINDYPTYSSTSTATGNINIDGASYSDYNFSNGSSAATYTPVITSPPPSGNVRYVTLTVGGGAGVDTMTWTNVTFMGTTGAAATTTSKKSTYACKIPSSGKALCSIVAEAY